MARPSTTKTEEHKDVTAPVEKEQYYALKLTHNYRPIDTEKCRVLDPVEDEFGNIEKWEPRPLIGSPEKYDEDGKIRVVAIEEYNKIWADTVIEVPKDEARRLLQGGIATRLDDLV